MTSYLIAAVEYGGYISIWKLLLFIACFLGWMPLVNWIFTDSQAVRTNRFVWTLSIALTGISSLLIMLLRSIRFSRLSDSSSSAFFVMVVTRSRLSGFSNIRATM